jgi:DNA relaxase NicK
MAGFGLKNPVKPISARPNETTKIEVVNYTEQEQMYARNGYFLQEILTFEMTERSVRVFRQKCHANDSKYISSLSGLQRSGTKR